MRNNDPKEQKEPIYTYKNTGFYDIEKTIIGDTSPQRKKNTHGCAQPTNSHKPTTKQTAAANILFSQLIEGQ